jgi:hypothetical protein
MRSKIAFAAIVGLALWGSTPTTNAQTGEFAGQVPSSVIRNAWQMQDEFQNARSAAPVKSVDRTAPGYGASNSVKLPGSVTTPNGTKTK